MSSVDLPRYCFPSCIDMPRWPDETRFVHICDTHVVDASSAEIVGQAVPLVNSLAPDFVVMGGDLANHGSSEAYEALSSALEPILAPVHYVIGNHDFLGGKATFEDHLGPRNFSFEAGPRHAICLDTTGRTSLTWEGLLTGETLQWLQQHLSAVPVDCELLLFTHHGIQSRAPHAPKQNLLWDVLNYKPLHALLANRNLVLACAGHAHMNADETWGQTRMLWTGALSSLRANHGDLGPCMRVVRITGGAIDTSIIEASLVD